METGREVPTVYVLFEQAAFNLRRNRGKVAKQNEMIVLFVLLISLLLYRTIGALGVAALTSWTGATRYALATMLVFTASAHFTKMKHDLVRMMPDWIPQPMALIYFTGVCEIAGAVGLMLPYFRQAAGGSTDRILHCGVSGECEGGTYWCCGGRRTGYAA